MNDMFAMSATEVRRDWSAVMDSTIRQKPQFIKRTRDYLMLADVNFMELLLDKYSFTAEELVEDDGSITLSLNEIDLVVNAPTEQEAVLTLARDILEYAQDYYREFNLWSVAPNRKDHIPYVMKALILDNIEKIGACIQCQAGKN